MPKKPKNHKNSDIFFHIVSHFFSVSLISFQILVCPFLFFSRKNKFDHSHQTLNCLHNEREERDTKKLGRVV